MITISDIVGSWQAGFLDANGNPFQGIKSSQSTATIVLSAIFNGVFEVNNTITGSTSNATAKVTNYDAGTQTLICQLSLMVHSTWQIHYLRMGGTSATITSVSYAGDTYDTYPTAAPTYSNDDKEVLVYHRNHCMHQRTNNVEVSGIVSEIPSTTLTSTLSRCYYYSGAGCFCIPYDY